MRYLRPEDVRAQSFRIVKPAPRPAYWPWVLLALVATAIGVLCVGY